MRGTKLDMVFIHGIGDHGPGFSKPLREALRQFLKLPADQLMEYEYIWSQEISNYIDNYERLQYQVRGIQPEFLEAPIKYIDRLVMYMIAYTSDSPTVKDKRLKEHVLRGLHELIHDQTREDAELVLVGHSLGSLIAFDYTFGFIPVSMRTGHCSPKPVSYLIILGTPLPIFTSAVGYVRSELGVKPEVSHSLKGWLNVIISGDLIARSIKPHFPELVERSLIFEEIIGDPAIELLDLNLIDEHSKYLGLNGEAVKETRKTAEIIAKFLARFS